MSEAEKRIALSKRIDAAIHDRDNIGIWPRRVFAGTPEDWEIILAALSAPNAAEPVAVVCAPTEQIPYKHLERIRNLNPFPVGATLYTAPTGGREDE